MVFGSKFAQIGALSLLAFLLIQPIAPVFASELIEEPQEQTVSEEIIVNDEQVSSEGLVSEGIEEEEQVVDVTAPEEEMIEPVTSPEPETIVDDEESVDVDPEVSPIDDSASTTEAAPEIENDEQGDTEEEGQTEEDPTTADPDQEDIQNNEDESLESDEEVIEETISASTTRETTTAVVHNTSAYQFDTKECTSVGDGAYYCSEAKSDSVFVEDGVFSAPDADGDLEIFVRIDGESTQLTFNQRDDSAPYYDAVSDRIVWHSQINDRYQIVSYDLKTREEVILTNTTYNNMEPVAFDSATVWQAWINNNWEILVLQSGTLSQLTNNTLHDVSPHIREDHVVWQTQYAEGWQISVYDLKTGQITNLPSENGARIENPRFVLVYDTTNEAGDVQTMGYDPNESRSFLLNSIPVELPDELPDPDQTGETRALIQNKTSVKGIEIEEAEPTPTPSAIDPHGSTTPELPTLDMRNSTGTLMSASTTIAMSDIEDLVISSSTLIAQEDPIDYVSDLVIPPSASTTEQ